MEIKRLNQVLVKLPDGSLVVLKTGSTIRVLDRAFAFGDAVCLYFWESGFGTHAVVARPYAYATEHTGSPLLGYEEFSIVLEELHKDRILEPNFCRVIRHVQEEATNRDGDQVRARSLLRKP